MGLKESHSKTSNFKLTLICLFLALGFSLVFISLSLLVKYQLVGIILLCIGSVISFISYLSIRAFVR